MKTLDSDFKLSFLLPKYWLSWLGILLLVLFGALSPRLRDPIARQFTRLIKKISKKPIAVARANLTACFPEKSKQDIEKLITQNIDSFLITLLGQTELMLRSRETIRKRVNITGEEHIIHAQQNQQPIIFIIPHVWAMEYAGTRLNLDLPMTAMIKPHKNKLFSWSHNKLRSQLGCNVYTRTDGIRPLITELKKNRCFFYLPDEDQGIKKSIFTPFLGTTKATLPVIKRLANAGNARVIPLKIGYNQQKFRFDLTVMPAIELDELHSKQCEATALNQAIEKAVLSHPEQYMWMLKLLKTRPENEAPIYQ